MTAESDETRTENREMSRWLAYPLLIFAPIVAIYLGIRLGEERVLSDWMYTSQYNTPVENWTLALIVVFIALVAWSFRIFARRAFDIDLSIVVLVVLITASVFIFGGYGLTGLALPIVLVFYWLGRRKLKRETADTGSTDGQQR